MKETSPAPTEKGAGLLNHKKHVVEERGIWKPRCGPQDGLY